MEYLTTVEMSKKWNISSRRIGVLCTERRIEGAVKKGKMWLLLLGIEALKESITKYRCLLRGT